MPTCFRMAAPSTRSRAALWSIRRRRGRCRPSSEGSGFYGIPLDQYLPYSVARTWHTQLGLFWIATSWLATGLYIAPAVSGVEPRVQKLGVNLLFAAVLFVVVSSLGANGWAYGRSSETHGSGSALRGTSTWTSEGSGRYFSSSVWSSGCGSCGGRSSPRSGGTARAAPCSCSS